MSAPVVFDISHEAPKECRQHGPDVWTDESDELRHKGKKQERRVFRRRKEEAEKETRCGGVVLHESVRILPPALEIENRGDDKYHQKSLREASRGGVGADPVLGGG